MKELGRGKYEKILKEEKEMDIFSLGILHGIHFSMGKPFVYPLASLWVR